VRISSHSTVLMPKPINVPHKDHDAVQKAVTVRVSANTNVGLNANAQQNEKFSGIWPFSACKKEFFYERCEEGMC
jgi:hypothetical protein